MNKQELPSRALEEVVGYLGKLPGVGARTALRYALQMLRMPEEEALGMVEAIRRLCTETQYCERCHNISDSGLCGICGDDRRDKGTICVVEGLQDLLSLEGTMQYRGVYHVLGGLISPMDGVSPQDLSISHLVERVKEEGIREVIFALSTTMEGDTTVFYIQRMLGECGVKLSRIARGVPVGDSLQYADQLTLIRAMEARTVL